MLGENDSIALYVKRRDYRKYYFWNRYIVQLFIVKIMRGKSNVNFTQSA
jgi:hypothetical protein